ncbi:hypothetical protein VP1G_04031 [Cytospora mali]|uniref:Uncharacterized protein n=1 Tax=Cytospora mali TaxID=578113 RepID=A0A194UYB2_CYTMA|nr:hypothetical protein VP1G_04031 [Valsa mali var. pyri (nom. inval.)]
MEDKRKPFIDPTVDPAPPPSFLGATSSAAGPSGTSTPFHTRLASVSLHMQDRIRFLNLNPSEIRYLRESLGAVWPLQEVRSYGGTEEFKFKGYPWVGKVNGDDQARRLVRRLLEALFEMGWVLQASVDVGKLDMDTLVFRYQNPPPPPCDWLSISFDWTNKMKIVDAPSPELTDALVAEFTATHKLKSHELESDRLKLKFHGQPWQAPFEETVQLRMLVLKLLETLERFEYSLYASIDQVNGAEAESDVLVVTRQKGWAPGMPIWHR